MSNRSYLTVGDHERIYPAFGDLPFNPMQNVALACDGCVPLLWLALFTAEDLRAHTFELQGQKIEAVAPVGPRTPAVARLRARAPFLNEQFKEQGGVQEFIELLARHLESVAGSFVSIELEEIEALNAEYDIADVLKVALQRLDAEDSSCLDLLIPLSTVLEDRSFLPPERAAQSGQREDLWNVYRLIGGGWLLPTPWDQIDERIDLSRMLNASRPRDAFATRI